MPPDHKDYFSSQAKRYANSRPDYPAGLIDFVAGLSARHELAWDCATGSGQAAVPLASHFAHVVATDVSENQIAHARPHRGVEYRVATAEASRLETASVDLVTVAQALHWLDRDRFYAEVRRVLAPGGAIAVWSYGDPAIEDDPAIDAVLQRFNHETLARIGLPAAAMSGRDISAMRSHLPGCPSLDSGSSANGHSPSWGRMCGAGRRPCDTYRSTGPTRSWGWKPICARSGATPTRATRCAGRSPCA